MISFKLSQPGDNAIRKASFDRAPSWEELAAKVEGLFKLQRGEVGLSYVDNDGDAVTISTDEELSDFYAQNTTKIVKFSVTRLAPRAPSVAQVPDAFYSNESPEPVIVEEQDWGGPRREGMLGAMPAFSTLPPNVLNSMQFGFIPGEVDTRAGTPAFSEARIEEVPSELPSRTQSVDGEANYNKEFKRPVGNMARPMGGKGKERLQRPVKGRQITDLSALDSADEAPKDPRSRFNVNAPAKARDSVASEAGSDIEDPGVPLLPRVAPNATLDVGGAPPSIYSDIAGVIVALNQVLIRAADGSYLQPQMESAVNMANDVAKAAIEDSARRVNESLQGVLRTLGAQAPLHRGPTGVGTAGFGMGAPPPGGNSPVPERANLRSNSSSNGRPRPWSMFNDRFPGGHGPAPAPPPFGGPPREESTFQTGQVPDSQMPPPFVPPSFPPKFNPQTPRGYGAPFASTPGSQKQRGLFSDTPPPQASRPMTQDRATFTGTRFQPAAGPLSSQTPRQGQQPTIMEVLPDASALSPGASMEETARQEERERLEAARQLYKQEKANFRAQREAERLDRAERKARREKGGPEASQLMESLEAAFGQPVLAEDVEAPQPVRPSDLPGLFAPPTHGHYTAAEPEDEDSWENPPLPKPQPWHRPMRGPNHEQNERLIARLADMGFAEASQPQLPGIVRQQTKNNLGKSDDELIERILEVLISADGARPTARAGPSSGRRR